MVPHLSICYFLKCYQTEASSHKISGLDEKTFRKWSWKYVVLISCLNVVWLAFVWLH